jgi:hypothetical protein
MAIAPQSPPKPATPPPPPKPAAQAAVKPREDEPLPKEFQTTQEEQLERSARIEAMGVEAWKDMHDMTKDEPEHHKIVPGVAPPSKANA